MGPRRSCVSQRHRLRAMRVAFILLRPNLGRDPAGSAFCGFQDLRGHVSHPCHLYSISIAYLTSAARATKRPLAEVQRAWDALEHPVRNDTNLHEFLLEYFHPAGAELTALPEEDVSDLIESTNATFLKKLNNTINQEFVGKVVQIWGNLTRAINDTAVCDACEKSFIAPQRPFVVAGGRFREMYYWDSYWIIQGLLRSGGGFINISRNQIENFFDNVEQFGFVPNGARRYYLNRSQPPLLSQMVRIYLDFTGDLSILDRGLPLLVKEHAFFESNRSVTVPVGNQTHVLNR